MKKAKMALIPIIILAIALSFIGRVKNPYVQEYVAGQGNIKGNINIEDFYERDHRFEIGATADGYAVFKDPNKAYFALLENYSGGISLIQKEYKLLWISRLTYPSYQIYGWQTTTGSEEARRQAQFVSSFFDIYENSFK